MVKEKRIYVIAAAAGAIGLLLVWYLVENLWARGWSMDIVHLAAVSGATLVTLTCGLVVMAVIARYRRILERKNEELEKLAAIGGTVAELAHYQKNLLNGLRGGLYVADGGLTRGDLDRLRTGWGMLNDSVLRIERMTLDMLYYVSKSAARREPTDLNQVIRDVVGLMKNAAAGRKVELRSGLDERLDPQLLDRTAVYRSLLNLVSNAIDACAEAERGGVVTLTSVAVADGVRIAVSDDGIGMPDEVLSKLFTRFFSTKGGRGTGLGLAVVKKVVTEHGGSLEVESAPGEGSTFRLFFPRADAPAGTAEHLYGTEVEGEKNVGEKGHIDCGGPGGDKALSVAGP